ncbi:MAG: hypothetical protein RMJ84_03655 [Sandaracinaceae bacterium]|nr:hypothetical protein [Sandaracinaceae bacterium]
MSAKIESTPKHGPITSFALERIGELKPEHQELLSLLVKDKGISPATLEHLVDHLLQEESPALRQGATLIKNAHSVQPQATRTTVGNLRRIEGAQGLPRRSGLTVGSLRKN